jgi:hypothetical protein
MHPSLSTRATTYFTRRSTGVAPLSKLVSPQGKQLSLKVDFTALNEANNGSEVATRVSDGVFAA